MQQIHFGEEPAIMTTPDVGPFQLNRVTRGDCLELATGLPDESIDVLVTSPPYWG